jgi:hypothetical protein
MYSDAVPYLQVYIWLGWLTYSVIWILKLCVLVMDSLVAGVDISATEVGNMSGPSAQEFIQRIKVRKA